MYARVITSQAALNRLDEGVATWQSGQVNMVGQPGFLGNTMLVDRQSGKVMVVAFWETEAALQATMPGIQEAWDEARQQGYLVTPTTIEVFEVAAQNNPQ